MYEISDYAKDELVSSFRSRTTSTAGTSAGHTIVQGSRRLERIDLAGSSKGRKELGKDRKMVTRILDGWSPVTNFTSHPRE